MEKSLRELLLKDLCARLPYGVVVQEPDYYEAPLTIATMSEVFYNGLEVKPYLRPVSSMTEEEMDKLFDILHINKDGRDDDWIKINDELGIKFFFSTGKWIENVAEAYDYLKSIHIDYRGLIPMGLALEAPEDMYK